MTTTMNSEPILEVRGLVHRQQNPSSDDYYEVRIEHVVIPRNGFVTVIGKTGSGKTTLLHVLSLLTRPSRVDEWSLLGVDLTQSSQSILARLRRQCLGVALQNPELISALTVAENVGLPLMLNGMDRQVERMDYILNGLGIPTGLGEMDLVRAKDRSVHHISGGQRQRVSLARAVIHQPAILFVDEPTSSLDEETAEKVVRFLDELRCEEDITIVMTTHNPRIIAEYATQVIHVERHKNVGRAVVVERSPRQSWF